MRLALACTECGWRVFDDPTARCPTHPGKTCIQRNRPYMGQERAQPEVDGLKVVDPTEPPTPSRRGGRNR